MNSIQLKAYAKINLGLDVIRRRPDGYHDVKMIMQTVNLYDKLNIHTSKVEGNNKAQIFLTCSLSYLPVDENNLVYKAAKLLMDRYSIEDNIHIHLEKIIPIAAGLAGGSSDAAATLYGMNRLCKLKLSKKELMDLGVKLGADIPYCILRGTALSEGIGEQLTPLKPFPSCHLVLIKPSINVSTKYVYESLVLDDTTKHPDINKIITYINEENLYGAASEFHNVLEDVTIQDHPIIASLKNEFMELGAITALMSGSGPTVFALFDSKEKAKKAYQIMKYKEVGKQVFLTELFQPSGKNCIYKKR